MQLCGDKPNRIDSTIIARTSERAANVSPMNHLN
jgi:hypothetical protein